MSGPGLLLGTSLLALCAASASLARPPTPSFAGKFNPFKSLRTAKMLYNQNSSDAGGYIDSENFTSGQTQYNDQGADDFVVPIGLTWRVTEVDVTGVYYRGSGPATSENVIFYKNK